jgi:CubicO group peptidase (beta-lactamase class C family)
MRLILVLLVFLGGGGLVNGQTAAAGRFAKVDAWLEENTPKMGGRAVLMVEKGGEMVYSRAVNDRNGGQKVMDGWMARKEEEADAAGDYTLKTRQPIASCSKWLSAALVMTFVDEGKLNLDDTVGKWLPVLTAHGKGGITVRQCLSHLTGIQEPPLMESINEMREVRSMGDAIELIAKMPMEGKAGSVFHYSSAGLQIAGAILEKIGGKSFGELFSARVARPLGMVNTDFGKGPVALPAGGASSTPEDYMHFLKMIMDKGIYHGVRVLSESSVAEMQVDRLGPRVRIAYTPVQGGVMARVGYGYGEWIIGDAVSSPGLFGSLPWVVNDRGYCAFLMVFYLNDKGKQQRHAEIMKLVDEACR